MSDHVTRLISKAADQYVNSDKPLTAEDVADLEKIRMDGVVTHDAAIDGLKLLSDLFFASTHTEEITINPIVVSSYLNFLAGVCASTFTLRGTIDYLIHKCPEGRRAKGVR